jgi:hypothetical protein
MITPAIVSGVSRHFRHFAIAADADRPLRLLAFAIIDARIFSLMPPFRHYLLRPLIFSEHYAITPFSAIDAFADSPFH